MKTYVFSDEHNCDHTYVLAADAQATVEALQAIIKQMGEQACVLAKDGMAAKAQVEAAERHNTILQDANKVALEKVEALQRELEHAKKMEAVQKEVADNQTWHVQTLRQLVAALPVPRGKVVVHPPCVGMIEGTYDVRIEWQEGNSFKSIRTAQFHVKENAEALAALLTYRATQDATTPTECTNHFTDGSKIFPSRNCCSKGGDGE